MISFPNTVQGAVLRLSASFVNSRTNTLVVMTGGSARVRVVDANNAIVLDEDCTISGTEVFYEWDTTGVPLGKYRVQFDGTPPTGTLFIEPYVPIPVTIGARIGE